jgi:hypothetical protein
MEHSNSLRVAEQIYLPLPLPQVFGNKDYQTYLALFKRIDRHLNVSGIEIEFQERALVEAEANSKKVRKKSLSEDERLRIQKTISQALRCNIARVLSGKSFRKFAFYLGSMSLLQEFCRLDRFDCVKVPGKSTLQEYSEMFEVEEIKKADQVVAQALSSESGAKLFDLSQPLDFSVALLDSSCVELNIHFPVDWVLLRDAVRTLSKAIDCIRRHGLKSRIKEPAEFRSQMNGYCIAMGHAKRGEKARKERKRILRLMKKLTKCVEKHAKSYRSLLLEKWESTDLKEGEVRQIIKRVDNILSQLPEAIKQAHQRIITEKLVSNEEKILSLYESHAKVYHRGKAGCETEFGLQLLLAESTDGLIIDWDFVEGFPKNDTQHLKPCVKRLKEKGVKLKHVVGDRGFASKTNSKYLKQEEIGDHLCPRKVIDLQERIKEGAFKKFQKRRAQTEARLGILKNNFIGRKMPMKGFSRQQKHIAWCVLSHNLWVVARMAEAQAPPLSKVA